MSAVGKTTSSLSLRLLRTGYTIDDAFRSEEKLTEIGAKIGRLFIGQSKPMPPTWLGFVQGFAEDDRLNLANQNCAAVLFLMIGADGERVEERIVALSFGSAHHSLNPNAFERHFGLRVVLNAVARSNLRNLDVATLDATTFQKRIQASRDADLQGFGIDVDRDLLTLASGSPNNTDFARSLAGRDALTINAPTTPTDVEAKCKEAIRLFSATDYQRDFSWIDHIKPVPSSEIVNELDADVFSEIKRMCNGNASDLHLALPDVLSPLKAYEIGYYGAGLKSGHKQAYPQLEINDYVDQLTGGQIADISDIAKIKNGHEIRVIVDGQGNKKQKRKVYDCFVYEVARDDGVYVLYGGEWYLVDSGFYAEIERDFQGLLSSNPIISSTIAVNEGELIDELDKDIDLLKLDQVKINPAGAAHANLEPCDFLSRTKQFIHLKDGHNSEPISHLWNQGVVSAESVIRDNKFRKDLRSAIREREITTNKAGFLDLVPDGRTRIVPADYTVIFGIMREPYKKTQTLGLPFFSKISLRPVARRIQMMGFGLEIHLIEKARTPGPAAPAAPAPALEPA